MCEGEVLINVSLIGLCYLDILSKVTVMIDFNIRFSRWYTCMQPMKGLTYVTGEVLEDVCCVIDHMNVGMKLLL